MRNRWPGPVKPCSSTVRRAVEHSATCCRKGDGLPQRRRQMCVYLGSRGAGPSPGPRGRRHLSVCGPPNPGAQGSAPLASAALAEAPSGGPGRAVMLLSGPQWLPMPCLGAWRTALRVISAVSSLPVSLLLLVPLLLRLLFSVASSGFPRPPLPIILEPGAFHLLKYPSALAVTTANALAAATASKQKAVASSTALPPSFVNPRVNGELARRALTSRHASTSVNRGRIHRIQLPPHLKCSMRQARSQPL